MLTSKIYLKRGRIACWRWGLSNGSICRCRLWPSTDNVGHFKLLVQGCSIVMIQTFKIFVPRQLNNMDGMNIIMEKFCDACFTGEMVFTLDLWTLHVIRIIKLALVKFDCSYIHNTWNIGLGMIFTWDEQWRESHMHNPLSLSIPVGLVAQHDRVRNARI